MRYIIIFICFSLFTPGYANVDSCQPLDVYLIHGQGSDYRIFQDIDLGQQYQLIPLHLPVPEKGELMHSYALRVMEQIDTTQAFVLVGVSMGGMVCTELASVLKPEKCILISSAKKRDELPLRYRFMKYIPLYKILPAGLIKAGSFIAQPLFEPDRKNNKATFVAMLKAKDPKFLKRSTNMIVKWDPSGSPEIVHIHGTKDHTLPYRRVKADYTVFQGSHMMTLTQANLISGIITEILSSNSTIASATETTSLIR